MTLGSDPNPSVVGEVVPMIGEFELDEETQLKVVAPSPDPTDFELPEHVKVLFLQTIESVDLPDKTVQGLKLLLRDHQDTSHRLQRTWDSARWLNTTLTLERPDLLSSHRVDPRLLPGRPKTKS